MKVRLMHPEENFDPEVAQPPFSDDLVKDLQLEQVFGVMAGGDEFLYTVCKAGVLHPLTDPEVMRYRQQALADCLSHRRVIEELYAIAVDAVTVNRGLYAFTLPNRPERELDYAVKLLTALLDQLERLRRLRPQIECDFASAAFRGFAAVLAAELDGDYLTSLRGILQELRFAEGMLMSAGVGTGGVVTAQILRRPKDSNRRFFNRTPLRRPMYSFTIPDRDEAGGNALAELRERSVNEVANAATQALDHVRSFFAALRIEIGFYRGCANLVETLDRLGAPVCMPDPTTASSTSAVGLYDPCLAVRRQSAPVGNHVELGHSRLLLITGANRGGKSTLLRALGTAQLMMQAGMCVAAERFAAHPVGRLFPHWAREEDTGLTHGKLDEELERMGRIVAAIGPGDLLLCNESFASTNEAEGSQLLLELTTALVGAGVQLRSVTHLFDYADAAACTAELEAVCLRAPRAGGKRRSFRLEPGPPLPTSYGLDLWDRVFGTKYADSG